MKIVQATIQDLDSILSIYAIAREAMRKNGNPTQWGDGYPQAPLLTEDILARRLYLVTGKSGAPCGVFAFILGKDPTYAVIEGKWPNDLPYGTIHRIAANGLEKGVFEAALSFCLKYIDIIRADTHSANLIMQHLLEKNGFQKCGIIYVRDRSPRLAYQLTRGKSGKEHE